MLAVKMTDRAALQVYSPHPLHVQFVTDCVAPIRENALVMDIDVE
jgi:hypothetical protein